MVRKITLIFLIASIGIPLFSDVNISASLSGLVTANRVGDSDITASSLAKGYLSLNSSGLNDVKSQLTLDFTSMKNLGILSISKAWIKFRFPLFRVTLGKNRITWGEGAAFNAGDVIFDDYSAPGAGEEGVDLTAEELRSMNRTLAQLIVPFGRFTYGELIFLPYDFPLYIEAPVPYYELDSSKPLGYSLTTIPDYKTALDLTQQSYGGRFVTKAGGIKLESGYIYNGYTKMHKPYISFDGTLGVDYHLSTSASIENEKYEFENWKESLKISAGVFYLFNLEEDRSLTLRVEALVKPFTESEKSRIFLYPEISLVPNDEIALFLRGIINPLDLDINSTLGMNWKTYQGFSIGTFFNLKYKESEELDLSLTVAVTHKF